jgi:hypothetical protein
MVSDARKRVSRTTPEQRAEGAHDEGRLLELKILDIDDWRLWRELRIEALREAPYAFGSKLKDWRGAGDTEERWRARLREVPLNIIARLDGKPGGDGRRQNCRHH